MNIKHVILSIWQLGVCLSWYKVSLLLLHKPDWRKGRKNSDFRADPLREKNRFSFLRATVKVVSIFAHTEKTLLLQSVISYIPPSFSISSRLRQFFKWIFKVPWNFQSKKYSKKANCFLGVCLYIRAAPLRDADKHTPQRQNNLQENERKSNASFAADPLGESTQFFFDIQNFRFIPWTLIVIPLTRNVYAFFRLSAQRKDDAYL